MAVVGSKRWVLRLAFGSVFGLLGVVALMLALIYAALEHEPTGSRVFDEALPWLNSWLPGEIRYGSFRGHLGHHLVLEDVEVYDDQEVLCLRARRVEVSWEVWDLSSRLVSVDRLDIDQPEVFVVSRLDGRLNWLAAFVEASTAEPEPPSATASPWTVRVAGVQLRGGSLEVSKRLEGGLSERQLSLEGVALEGDYALAAGRQDIRVVSLEVQVQEPFPAGAVGVRGSAVLEDSNLETKGLVLRWEGTRMEVSGRVEQLSTPRLDLVVRTGAFHLDDLRRLAPELPLTGTVALDLRAQGPLEHLQLDGGIGTPGGGRIGLPEIHVDSGEVLRHRARIELESVDVNALLREDTPLEAPLSGGLQWAGSGASAEAIAGSLDLDLSALDVAGVRLDRVHARALIEGKDIGIEAWEVGAYRGEASGLARVHLEAREASGQVEVQLPELQALRPLLGPQVPAGTAGFQGQWALHWGAEEGLELSTDGVLQASRITGKGLAVGQVTGDWNLRLEGLGTDDIPSVYGPLSLQVKHIGDGSQQRLQQASLRAQVDGLAASVELQASRGAELLASLTGRPDWSRLPTLRFTEGQADLLAGSQLLETARPFDFKVRGSAVQWNNVVVELQPGTLVTQGLYDPATEVAATAKLRSADLEALRPLALELLRLSGAPADLPKFSGRIDEVRLRLAGPSKGPALEFSAAVEGLEVGEAGPTDLSLRFGAEDGQLSGTASVGEILALELQTLPLRLRVDGRGLPFWLDPEGSVEGTVDLPRSSVAQWAAVFGIEVPASAEEGAVRGALQWSGQLVQPTARADLRLSDLSLGGRRIQGQLGLVLSGDTLQVEDSRLRTAADGRILEFFGSAQAPVGRALLHRLGPQDHRAGDAHPFLAELELGARIRSLPMPLVHLLAPALQPLTGALRGEFHAAGDASNPALDLELELLDGRAGTEVLTEVRAEASLRDERLWARVALVPEHGGGLAGEGGATFPLKLTPDLELGRLFGQEDLDIELQGDGFPLAPLLAFVPGTTEVEGLIRVDGRVKGSLRSPQPNLSLEMAGGRFCHEVTSVCYEDFRLDGRLEAEQLSLDELSFETMPQLRNPIDLVRRAQVGAKPGSLRARGTMRLSGLSPKWTELDVVLDRVWASSTQQIKAQVDGSLSLGGYYPALKATGDITLPVVDVSLGRSETGRQVQALDLPDRLAVHRTESRPGPGERAAEVEAEVGEEPTAVDRLLKSGQMDLKLRLGNQVHVALALGIAGPGGEAMEALSLLGSVEPNLNLGGEVNLQWSDETLTVVGPILVKRGSKLEVLTRDFEVEENSAIEFVGRLPDSQLNLRATHKSRYGGVTVVVTDRMASPSIRFESEVFEDQADMMSVLLTGKPLSELSTAEGSQALSGVAGALAGFGTKAFGRYVPVDSLSVELGEDVRSGSLEAGKSLGPNVFLLTRFRWGAKEGQNRVEGQLEVQITPRIYFETRIGDRLEGAAEVVWKIQF